MVEWTGALPLNSQPSTLNLLTRMCWDRAGWGCVVHWMDEVMGYGGVEEGSEGARMGAWGVGEGAKGAGKVSGGGGKRSEGASESILATPEGKIAAAEGNFRSLEGLRRESLPWLADSAGVGAKLLPRSRSSSGNFPDQEGFPTAQAGKFPDSARLGELRRGMFLNRAGKRGVDWKVRQSWQGCCSTVGQ